MIMLDYTSYICALSTLFTIMTVRWSRTGSLDRNAIRGRSERDERILTRVAISGDIFFWFSAWSPESVPDFLHPRLWINLQDRTKFRWLMAGLPSSGLYRRRIRRQTAFPERWVSYSVTYSRLWLLHCRRLTQGQIFFPSESLSTVAFLKNPSLTLFFWSLCSCKLFDKFLYKLNS